MWEDYVKYYLLVFDLSLVLFGELLMLLFLLVVFVFLLVLLW